MISPSSMVEIIERIESTLWEKFENKKYQNVERYISRWHYGYDTFGNSNFDIIKNERDKIDLPKTLDTMSDELLFKIAVDLNIEVPGLIYGVAEIKGALSQKYQDIGRTFEKAHEKIYSDPPTAIIMANSALERIIKKICSDKTINQCNPKNTSSKLVAHILKQFNLFPAKKLTDEIRNIGSGLLSVA